MLGRVIFSAKRDFHFSVKRYLSHKMPSALIILAQGAEEMETVISADVLSRGGVSAFCQTWHGLKSIFCPDPI